jgi:hypothetical protein
LCFDLGIHAQRSKSQNRIKIRLLPVSVRCARNLNP